jgi:ribulose-5-phosphate 4-epimerase/fuculose-1-phosphate aldolase
MLNSKTFFIEESIHPLRVDLAAALRLAAKFGWHESLANHFSVATSSDGKKFLMNPKWMHLSAVRASDLLLLDAEDPGVMDQANAPDPSAWAIHGAIHRRLPAARALMQNV